MKVEVNIDPGCREPRIVVHTAQLTPQLEALIRQLTEAERIPAQTERGLEMLAPPEIIRIYSEKQKVLAQTPKGIFTLKARLYEMEERLANQDFVRISSSELVNIRMITGMDFSLTGTIRLSLKGGIVTYVSRRQVSRIKALFEK